MIDNLGKFWILTKPRPLSEIEDILFQTDLKGLFFHIQGGLQYHEIFGIYPNEALAREHAEKLMASKAEFL